MGLRRGSYFSFPALLGMVGFWLIVAGSMGESDRLVKNGVLCLIGAVALLGVVFYVRWQGWVD